MQEAYTNNVLIQFPNEFKIFPERKRPPTTAPSTSSVTNNNGTGRDYSSSNSASYFVNINDGSYTDDQVSNANSRQGSKSFLRDEDIRLSGVTLYSEMMLLAVVMWTVYLILPKGLRQFMCNAYPKRFKRSSPNRIIPVHLLRWNNDRENQRRRRENMVTSDLPLSDYSNSYSTNSCRHKYDAGKIGVQLGSYGLQNRMESGIVAGRRDLLPAGSSDANSGPLSEVSPVASHASSTGTWDPRANRAFEGFTAKSTGLISPFQRDDKEEVIHFFTPSKPLPPPSLIDLESLASFSMASPLPIEERHSEPSPVHPNSRSDHRVPSQMVLSSTLTSLREPGIRLFAHGTQCEPRRIWIQLEVYKELIEWRTESKSKTGDKTAVVLGSKHTISLKDVIYVDVGKTTAALQLLSEDEVSSDLCFSILTKNGSLDLNAGNKLERDALISCFCLILDTIYLDHPDGLCWRDLYTADSSVASESTTHGFTVTAESKMNQARKFSNANPSNRGQNEKGYTKTDEYDSNSLQMARNIEHDSLWGVSSAQEEV